MTTYLAKMHTQLLPSTSAVVVEIGSGACSLPGIWLARRLTAARIVLTDLPSLLPLTEANVLANEIGHSNRLEVASLRWGCEADLRCGAVPLGPDLVIAADVVYFAEDVEPLFATMDALAANTMLVALMPRDGRGYQYDALVVEAAAARDWQVTRAKPSDDPMLAACVLFELRRRPRKTWAVRIGTTAAIMLVGFGILSLTRRRAAAGACR
jgi:hypothetical protein